MSNSRADEMVLAGSAPTTATGNDPVAHIHRGTSFIVLVDGAIVVYLLATALASMNLLQGTGGTVFLATGVFTTLYIYGGYRNRKPWAYWPAVSILFLASLMFGLLALINLIQAVLVGYFTGLLFVFLMGWAALGSARRAIFHWHPGYRSGYLRKTPMESCCVDYTGKKAPRPALFGGFCKMPTKKPGGRP
ncbi:MAG: hypothetical protein VXW82_03130, partial [Candidatus Thermoplasmatota archaeon]|nr:hypothetical protein [Candidatus Thermoplasmatota archaeon]